MKKLKSIFTLFVAIFLLVSCTSIGKTDNKSRLSPEKFNVLSLEDRPITQPDSGPLPELVPVKDSEGLWNLALLKTAKVNASSLIPGFEERHLIKNLNDGWYNNSNSWIPQNMPAWVEIDLGDTYYIQKVSLGSEHSPFFNDRAATKLKIYISDGKNGSTANNWIEVASYDNNMVPIRNTMSFTFAPISGNLIKIAVDESTGGDVRFDEIEIYGSDKEIKAP